MHLKSLREALELELLEDRNSLVEDVKRLRMEKQQLETKSDKFDNHETTPVKRSASLESQVQKWIEYQVVRDMCRVKNPDTNDILNCIERILGNQSALEREKVQFEEIVTAFRDKVDAFESQKRKLNQGISQLERIKLEYSANLAQQREKMDMDIRASQRIAEAKAKEIENERDAFRAEVANRRAELDNIEKRLREASKVREASLDEREATLAKIEIRRNQDILEQTENDNKLVAHLKQENFRLVSKLEELQFSYTTLEEGSRDCDRKLTDSNNTLTGLRNELKHKEEMYNMMAEHSKQLDTKLSNTCKQLEALKAKNAKIISSLEARAHQAETALANREREIVGALENRENALKLKAERWEQERTQVENSQQRVASELQTLERSLALRERDIEGKFEIIREREKRLVELQSLETQLRDRERTLNLTEQRLKNEQSSIDEQHKAAVKLDDQVRDRSQELKTIQSQLESKQTELKELLLLEQDDKKLQKRAETLQQLERTLREERRTFESKMAAEVKQNEVSKKSLERSFKKYESQVSKVAAEMAKVKQMQNRISQERTLLTSKIREVEEQKKQLAEQSHVLDVADEKLSEILARETRVAMRESDIKVYEDEVACRERIVERREEEVNGMATKTQSDRLALEERQAELEKKNRATHIELQAREASVSAHYETSRMELARKLEIFQETSTKVAREQETLAKKRKEIEEEEARMHEEERRVTEITKKYNTRKAAIDQEREIFDAARTEFQKRRQEWDLEQASLQREATETMKLLREEREELESMQQELSQEIEQQREITSELQQKQALFQSRQQAESMRMEAAKVALEQDRHVLKTQEQRNQEQIDTIKILEVELFNREEEISEKERKIVAREARIAQQQSELTNEKEQVHRKMQEVEAESKVLAKQQDDVANQLHWQQDHAEKLSMRELAITRREEDANALLERLRRQEKALEERLALQTKKEHDLELRIAESLQKHSAQVQGTRENAKIKRELQNTVAALRSRAKEVEAEQAELQVIRSELALSEDQVRNEREVVTAMEANVLAEKQKLAEDIEIYKREKQALEVAQHQLVSERELLKQEKMNQQSSMDMNLLNKSQSLAAQMELERSKMENEFAAKTRKLESKYNELSIELERSIEARRVELEKDVESRRKAVTEMQSKLQTTVDDQNVHLETERKELQKSRREIEAVQERLRQRHQDLLVFENQLKTLYKQHMQAKQTSARKNKQEKKAMSELAKKLEDYGKRLDSKFTPGESPEALASNVRAVVNELKELRDNEARYWKNELRENDMAYIVAEKQRMNESRNMAARQMNELVQLHHQEQEDMLAKMQAMLDRHSPRPTMASMEQEHAQLRQFMDAKREGILNRQKAERKSHQESFDQMRQKLCEEEVSIRQESQSALSAEDQVIEKITNQAVPILDQNTELAELQGFVKQLTEDREALVKELNFRDDELVKQKIALEEERKKMEAELESQRALMLQELAEEQEEMKRNWDTMLRNDADEQKKLVEKLQQDQDAMREKLENIRQETLAGTPPQPPVTLPLREATPPLFTKGTPGSPTNELQMLTPLLIARARTAREDLANAIMQREQWEQQLDQTDEMPSNSGTPTTDNAGGIDADEDMSLSRISEHNGETPIPSGRSDSLEEAAEAMVSVVEEPLGYQVKLAQETHANLMSVIMRSVQLSMQRLERLVKLLQPIQAERLVSALASELVQLLTEATAVHGSIVEVDVDAWEESGEMLLKRWSASVQHVESWYDRTEEKFHYLTEQTQNLMHLEHNRKMLLEEPPISCTEEMQWNVSATVTDMNSCDDAPSTLHDELQKCLQELEQSLKARHDLLENEPTGIETSSIMNNLPVVSAPEKLESGMESSRVVRSSEDSHLNPEEMIHDDDFDQDHDHQSTTSNGSTTENRRMEERDLNIQLQQITLDIALFDEDGDREELQRMKQELRRVENELEALNQQVS